MKKFLLILLGFILVGAGIGYYQWNKPHEKLSGKKAEVSVSANTIVSDFIENEMSANTKYVGKLVEVFGTIAELKNTEDGSFNILLSTDNDMSAVMCQLSKLEPQDAKGLEVGKSIRLKGICSGFTLDVILDRCIIVQ